MGDEVCVEKVQAVGFARQELAGEGGLPPPLQPVMRCRMGRGGADMARAVKPAWAYFLFAGGWSFGGGRKNRLPFALVLRANTLSAQVT